MLKRVAVDNQIGLELHVGIYMYAVRMTENKGLQLSKPCFVGYRHQESNLGRTDSQSVTLALGVIGLRDFNVRKAHVNGRVFAGDCGFWLRYWKRHLLDVSRLSADS